MAEGVLFNIAERIIVRLGNRAFQQIGSIWGVQDELNKLKETVAGFQAVLLDAEQKQANNNEVKLWLQSVEDAVYEADDVLDEFNTQVQRRQVMRGNTKLSNKVRFFCSSSNQLVFGLEISHKIRDINKRLSEVSSRRPNGLNDNREDTKFILRERVGHSFVPKENIIGRDEDKKALIQLLLDPISTENVSTISIVGFGGLGKTALAQLIFNDEVIKNHFELKIWTCVSNVFELDIVVKKILQSEHHGIEQLQNDLRKKVDGKKCLLVLDDVWNEDRKKWLSLKNLLMGGGEGSRILITTRSKTVATISDTAKPYTLKGLNEEQSWSLFKKMAYKDGKEPENSRIKEVGIEVARKCQGVPLAIRTIGGMLFTNDDETDWLNFKEKKLSKINQEEDDILPTLKLSYDVLPSHLKHCFAYCSLFPPDYEISVQRLIRLWVAQGFINSSDENEGLEDVAYKYYMELLCRSFFQEEKIDEFGIIKSCKMHDLMNELAILVSGVRSAVVDLNQKNFHENLHHVSFNFDIDLSKWEVPTSLLKANKIRTFLFLPQQHWYAHQSSSRNAFYTTIVSNFKSLRMLSLNKLRITTLPNCLRKMKHLRYLDLSGNPMKRLPDWIVGLSNLETLDLSDCRELVELPRDIKKMINLRHLILEWCPNSASSSSSTQNLSLPSFPSLYTLFIDGCPNLTSMPLYPNVERIFLEESSWKVVDSLFVRRASDIPHDVGVDVSASSSSPHLSKLTLLSLRGIEDLASLDIHTEIFHVVLWHHEFVFGKLLLALVPSSGENISYNAARNRVKGIIVGFHLEPQNPTLVFLLLEKTASPVEVNSASIPPSYSEATTS